jgi:hypothetical protein
MNKNEMEILIKIAELINSLVNKTDYRSEEDNNSEKELTENDFGCILKCLPERLLVEAARVAREINPANAPILEHAATEDIELIDHPQRIAIITSKYWGAKPRQLTVSFMESTPTNLRNRIISHLNAWTKTGCIEFVYTQGAGNVRISRGAGGYYSYLGTDILLVPHNRQTMNLQNFTMNTPESEFKRVVRHEAGHTLGFPHEHMRRELVNRIDRNKAYKYYKKTQGWNRRQVESQVLTPLEDKYSIIGTPIDQESCMCYRIPSFITIDGRPILGGKDITTTDYQFCGRIYPKEEQITKQETQCQEDDWSESEDIVPDL